MSSTVISERIFAVLIVWIFTLTMPLIAGKYKEIYFSKPIYLKRNTEQWIKQSRIVGELKNPPPEFVIEIYSHAQGKIIKIENFTDKLSIYESSWLVPGVYTIEIKAEGFGKTVMRSLTLNAASDCLINLDFHKIAYTQNY